MFDRTQLKRVVELQEKSYKLLRWVNDALVAGRLSFGKMHGAISMAQAAEEWIGRHYTSIPLEARPGRNELNEFSHLFASYLQTSFEISEKERRLASDCGCYCDLCTYFVSLPRRLKVRTPTKKARATAEKLKLILLRRIADELELPYLDNELEAILRERGEIFAAISWATYGQELLRRSEFASQGEGVLVLWREIAWDEKGRIKKNFRLSTNAFIEAEREIKARLTRGI